MQEVGRKALGVKPLVLRPALQGRIGFPALPVITPVPEDRGRAGLLVILCTISFWLPVRSTIRLPACLAGLHVPRQRVMQPPALRCAQSARIRIVRLADIEKMTGPPRLTASVKADCRRDAGRGG